jgi:hypothetical protein
MTRFAKEHVRYFKCRFGKSNGARVLPGSLLRVPLIMASAVVRGEASRPIVRAS